MRDRVVAEHALQVEHGEEEDAEHARDHQHLGEVGAGDVAVAQDVEPQQRPLGARLAPDERRQQRDGDARRAAASATSTIV